MSAALITIASGATSTIHEATTADAFGGFIALIVAIVAFLSIGGLALSMTIGASKSSSTMAITGIAGVLAVLTAVGLVMNFVGNHSHHLEGCPMSTWELIGSLLALAMGLIAVLTLGGLTVVMMIGGFAPSKQPVTSWAPEQERLFSGFDQRTIQAQSRAWTYGIVTAVLFFIFIVSVSKTVKPDIKDVTKDMNMSNLTKKSKSDKADAPKADAPKADAPKADAPKADAPKADAPKAEDPKQ